MVIVADPDVLEEVLRAEGNIHFIESGTASWKCLVGD